jgi:hypothetical protein
MHTAPRLSDLTAAIKAIRPAIALLKAHTSKGFESRDPVALSRQLWPQDRGVDLRTKAVTAPGSMTGADFASPLVGLGVADFASVLSEASASKTLLDRGLTFQFGQTGVIISPTFTADATAASFVTENAPIPVRQYSASSGPILKPKKFATISVFSREMFEHSIPTIESAVRAVVGEDLALGLDSKMLDDVAADAARPAGLRNGIAALAESALATRSEAMAADISTLVTGVAAVSGNAPIIIIASPAQAVALRLWNNANFNFEVLASSALSAGTVIAIASNCLVSAVDPTPRFEISNAAVIHFDNSSPADIATAGAPPGGLTKSLFQADCIGLRTILSVAWGLRSASGLAWIEDTVW